MAENVVLGKVLLPTPRQTPSGGRDDRPGSWTPPDSVAAAEALLAFWVSPPSPTERNAARMILHSTFSQASVGQRVSQLLQTALRPRRTSATSAHSDAGPAEPAVPPADSDRAAFCVKEFRRAEECWRTVHSECSGLEEDLRICFRSDWKEPRLATDKPAMLRNRLTSTRQGRPAKYIGAGGVAQPICLRSEPEPYRKSRIGRVSLQYQHRITRIYSETATSMTS